MRKHYIAITIDYEVWDLNGKPEGQYEINFQRDLIENTETLLRIAEKTGMKISIMAEMGEYLWLKENQPDMANAVAEQWRRAIRMGHDVQLHLHPNWLPEAGAQFFPYYADPELADANNYPFDLVEAIHRCVDELEKEIRPVSEDYKVTCYRTAGYRVQPFGKIFRALKSNGIIADSSVCQGAKDTERGYDFSGCLFENQPYKANIQDPSYEDANSDLIELPIYAYKKGQRWSMDYHGASNAFLTFLFGNKSAHMKANNFYVMIGHSKTLSDLQGIEQQFRLLKQYPGLECQTISEIVKHAQDNNCKFSDAERSIKEVGEIIAHLRYAFRGMSETDTIGSAVAGSNGNKTFLLCAAALSILRQWGYHCRGVKILCKKDKNKRNLPEDTDFYLLQLWLKDQVYTIDMETGSIFSHSVMEIIRNPSFTEGKMEKFFTSIRDRRLCSCEFWQFYEKKKKCGRRYELDRMIRNILFYMLPSLIFLKRNIKE